MLKIILKKTVIRGNKIIAYLLTRALVEYLILTIVALYLKNHRSRVADNEWDKKIIVH